MSTWNVAIVGMGVSGAMLANRLGREEDVDVTIFEKQSPSEVGSKCAWGTNLERLQDLVWLNVDDYVLDEKDSMQLKIGRDEYELGLRSMGTIDKTEFIYDLVGNGPEVYFNISPDMDILESYDLIIDATGERRYLMNDKTVHEDSMPCYQTKVMTVLPLDFRVEFTGNGYLWVFPLGEYRDGYLSHIGAGDFERNPREIVEGYMMSQLSERLNLLVLHREGGLVNLRPVTERDNFDNIDSTFDEGQITPIFGVGEAVGTVSPLTGEGIISSIKSAQILYECLREYLFISRPAIMRLSEEYERRLKEEFKSYEYEYKLMQALREGKMLKTIYNIIRMDKRRNVQVGLLDKIRIINSVRKFKKSVKSMKGKKQDAKVGEKPDFL